MAQLTEAYLRKLIRQVINENTQQLIYQDNFYYLGNERFREINEYVKQLHQGLNNQTTKENVETIINRFKENEEFEDYFEDEDINLNNIQMADFTNTGGLIHRYLNFKNK